MSDGQLAVGSLEKVGIRYGSHRVCDGVSMSVQRGAVCALLGRNGTGKTSLLRCVLGLQRPTSGTVRLLDADPWRSRVALMRRVGVVAEHPDAPPRFSAKELSSLCRHMYPRWDADAVDIRLKRYEIPPALPFGRLSRGQQQQVHLALALGHRPELLVLDDPTLGLDPVARDGLIAELVEELADRGTTVLLATQDMATFEGIALTVAILHGGHFALQGELETIKSRFRQVRYRRRESGTGPDGSLPELAGLSCVDVQVREQRVEVVLSDKVDEVIQELNAHPAVESLNSEYMTLEEIFSAVTGHQGGGQA